MGSDADRGYDADWIKAYGVESGAWANIPPRCNCTWGICFTPYLSARDLDERSSTTSSSVVALGHATTLAANDLAFIQLASIGVWLRVNEPRPWFSATAISDRAEIGKKPLTVSTAPAEDALELLVIAALSRHGERCNPVTGLEMLREDRCCLGPCNSSE